MASSTLSIFVLGQPFSFLLESVKIAYDNRTAKHHKLARIMITHENTYMSGKIDKSVKKNQI